MGRWASGVLAITLLVAACGGSPAAPGDAPPETQIDSTYPTGSAEAACDTFILTVNSWMDDIANGAELGPSLAEEADTLRVALQGLGIEAGLDQLRLVGEKWATLSWGQADEEGYPLLEEAARLLAEAAPRCGDLVEAVTYSPEPVAPTTTVGDPGVYGDFDCRTAPPEERTSGSSVPLTLIPNPVTAGASAQLVIDAVPEDRVVAPWGAAWECWNGSEWVGTHLLEFGMSRGGTVVPGVPGATTTIPASGALVPQRDDFYITIPNVPPGWYRLSVMGIGYLAVEVIADG